MKKLVLFVLSAVLTCATVGAQDTLVVALNPDFAPWHTKIGDKPAGIDLDIINYMAQKLGLKVEYKMAPWARCQSYLKDGTADILGFLAKNDERAVYAEFLIPAYQGDVKVFYTRKGEGSKVKNYGDLGKLKVGLLRGALQFDQFDKDTKLEKIQADTYDQAFQMLLKNRFDVVIGNQTEMIIAAKKLKLDGQMDVAPYTVSLPFSGYFALSKKSKFLSRKAEFEKILKDLLDSGQMNALIDKGIKTYS